MGERRGMLEVETAGGVQREDRAALETLSDQVALALETVARAREKADAERRRVRDLFSRFVPEAVVEEVLAQADGARLGGRALDGTIMFTDLRGFTSFSESRPADEVIDGRQPDPLRADRDDHGARRHDHRLPRRRTDGRVRRADRAARPRRPRARAPHAS